MRKITLLFAFLLTVSFGHAQQVLIEDFENSPALDSWSGASVATGNDPQSEGTRGQNMQVDITAAAGDLWQGAKITFPDGVLMDLTTDITVKVDIYSMTAMTIMGKVESNSGAPASADDQAHGGSGWETITFTFNSGADGTGTANGNYNLFAVFPNRDGSGGWSNPVVGSSTFYDNITAVLGTAAPGAEAPTAAAPTPPNRAAADVISLYSDAYTDIASNFDAGWCGANSVQEVMIADNATQEYLGNECQGIVFDAAIDASAFTHMHVDVYIDETNFIGKVFNFKFVETIAGGSVLEVNFNSGSNPPLEGGKWISIDVPVDLSDFDALKEFAITNNNKNNSWYDNLYFYKGTTLGAVDFEIEGLRAYPNPANSEWVISTKDQIINSIEVFNVLGEKVISLQPNSLSVKVDASSLATGMYFSTITTESGTASKKLVKN